MNHPWRGLAHLVATGILALCLGACGSSPWRFDPGVPGKPTGLVATGGDGQVTLTWTPALGATYTVYYATSPGVTATNSTKLAGVSSPPEAVTGLTNGTRYFFRVSGTNLAGEGTLSDEVNSIPSPPGPFAQADLEGTWRFNALVSGAGAKWMRGTVAIDAAGAVQVTSFSDSAGSTSAPAGLFSTLTLLSDGSVLQDAAAPDFHGAVAANLHRDLLVATTTVNGGSARMLLVLQKSVPGIVFDPADIQGTGQAGAGPLAMVYHQISSGPSSEWERASLHVGRDQRETYITLNGQTPRALPGAGAKVAAMSITSDGTITEAGIAGVLPRPAALLTQAVMSADKMTIVGTATDVNGAFILRVIQLVHPPTISLTSSDYLLSGLTGSYGYHALTGGAAPLWAHGTQTVGPAGNAAFTTYLDSSASAVLPAPATLVLDRQGALTDAAQPSFNGQFSYFKDMMVATRTDGSGAGSLSIALRSAN